MTKETFSGNKRGQGIDPDDFSRKYFTQFQTWLGETKSVEGCPIDCKYCFLQLDGQTPIYPKIGISPKDTLTLIENAYTYSKEMPIHFGSQTDAFSTKENIKYYTNLLLEYGESKYNNPIIFITKKEIPDDFVKIVKQIRQKVVFYISYSGLSGTEIEPNVNTIDLKRNFIKLKEAEIARVHYWRPFLPHNSNPIIINEILEFVSKYATCSTINGLKLNSGIMDNLIKFWPELSMEKFDFQKIGEVWPCGVRNYIKECVSNNYPDYPFFVGNTPCSLTYALETSDLSGKYSGKSCLESQCPDIQVVKCRNNNKIPELENIYSALYKMQIDPSKIILNEDNIIINDDVETGKIIYLKYLLKFPIVTKNILYKDGYNWANVLDDGLLVEIPWTRD